MNSINPSSDQTGHENQAFDGNSEGNMVYLPDPDNKVKGKDDTLPKQSTNVDTSSDQTGHNNRAFDGNSEGNMVYLPDPGNNVKGKDTLPKQSTDAETLSDINIDKQRRDNRKKRKDRERSSGGDRKQRKNSLAIALNRCDTLTKYSLGVFVRLMLIAGNALAAWRTVIETDDNLQSLWVAVCSILMFVEYSIIIFKKKGLEWTWWSPCFLIYLGSTMPLVWQLQLNQRDNFMKQLNSISDTQNSVPQSLVNDSSDSATSTTKATVQLQDISWQTILTISNDTWVIIVNESLVYLVIFSRWLLPRGEMTREFLADMLLEFLAIASDIMELLALFDEARVRDNLMLTYWILIAWSVSFIQFIPVLLHKRKYRHIKKGHGNCLKKACGNNFTEILATLMSIVVQDGSFLVVRMYIMVKLNFVTYSLTFFVMKNILSLLILFYRLLILIHNLPCCCGKRYQLNNSLKRTKTVSYDL